MLTDRAPRKPLLLAAFVESDRNRILNLPQGSYLTSAAKEIECSLEAGARTAIRFKAASSRI